MAAPGEIYWCESYYRDTHDVWRGKYLLVIGLCVGGFVSIRLLTSQQHGRPEVPECWHQAPYDGFHLGILGEPLSKSSWLSMHPEDDFEEDEFARKVQEGGIRFVTRLAPDLLLRVLECLADSEDVNSRQERAIRDHCQVLRNSVP